MYYIDEIIDKDELHVYKVRTIVTAHNVWFINLVMTSSTIRSASEAQSSAVLQNVNPYANGSTPLAIYHSEVQRKAFQLSS